MLSLLALLSLTPAYAAAPAVPPLAETPCYKQVMSILKKDYNDFKMVDGQKIGAEFVDATNFTALPVRHYFGMDGDFHFGLVGYARIDYHGDAVSHLYNYVVSATCAYNGDKKQWMLYGSSDGPLTKDLISLQSMDFER